MPVQMVTNKQAEPLAALQRAPTSKGWGIIGKVASVFFMAMTLVVASAELSACDAWKSKLQEYEQRRAYYVNIRTPQETALLTLRDMYLWRISKYPTEPTYYDDLDQHELMEFRLEQLQSSKPGFVPVHTWKEHEAQRPKGCV